MTIGILIFVYLAFAVLCFLASASDRRALYFLSQAWGGLALASHGTWLVMRGISAKHWPFTNTYETLVLLGFFMIALYLGTIRRHRIWAVGGFAGLIVSSLLSLTSFLPSDIEPLVPALKSNWLLFHVVSAFMGYSAFGMAAASAALYLVFDAVPEKAGREVFSRERLASLDWATYRLIAFGFPFLTLGIVLGSIWANLSWGRYWNWDSKETWAFITWLVYAVCLHMRQKKELWGRATALVTLIGFATVMFTYFGVNFWLSSLHAYG